MNTIEPSKSSRAACRSCGQKIIKAEPRLGVEETFTIGGEEVTSIKWHHLKCGMIKIPEAAMSAKIIEEVTSRGKSIRLREETLRKITEFKSRHNTSGIAVKGISEIHEADKTVNIEAEVIRKLSPGTDINPNGDEELCAKVYVKFEDHRSSIYLWGDHSQIEMVGGNRIVILKSVSFMATNDNIQFHAGKGAKVLINPTEIDLSKNVEQIELYIGKSWKRPRGKPAEFQYAPSGRAACGYCEKSISMGDLKLVKPSYIEIPTGRIVPGNVSFHLGCILQDEHGLEVVREAVSRLNLDILSDSHKTLSDFASILPASEVKNMLNSLL